MKRPSFQLAIEINQRVRGDDEWFDEPDDVERVESVLRSIDDHLDPVEAVLLARWTLDNNGLDGARIIRPDDRELADLLVHAASGRDVETDVLQFFAERA